MQLMIDTTTTIRYNIRGNTPETEEMTMYLLVILLFPFMVLAEILKNSK